MNNKGFTLLELAIVLVIIGILMGAVLRGQELIKSAKEKKFFSQLQMLGSAQLTYLQREGRYAGDTDEDGFIDNDNNAWDELEYQHLILKKDKAKQSVFAGVTFNFSNGYCKYFGGSDDSTTLHGNYIQAGANLPQWVAQTIDNRIDDGYGNSGYIRWSSGGDPCGQDYDKNNSNKVGNLYWFFDL